MQIKRLVMGFFEFLFLRHATQIVGYIQLAIPVFGRNSQNYLESTKRDVSNITKDYLRNSSLMVNLGKSIGKIVSSYKDIQSVAGYTALVSNLEDVMKDCNNGVFVKGKFDLNEGKVGMEEPFEQPKVKA